MRTAPPPVGHATEADLWQAHLLVLRQALCMRKPDAIARVHREAGRLEREVDALQARRLLTERAGGVFATHLADTIAERLRRISDLAGLKRTFGGKTASDDAGPAAEAKVRRAAIDPIDLLHGKGKLSADQMRAAREIAWVHEAIARAGRARVSRLSEIDPPTGWREMALPERAALIHAKRFVPWAERLRRGAPATLDIVLRTAVLGTAIYPLARKHRIGWQSCVARLADGLDQYWQRPPHALKAVGFAADRG
ncbi:MAG TPA: hypothetical protein VFG64_05405 [Dongiaceae bacterium]|nr:hypothetical protein [Dongiaceae bacterium]